MGLDEVLRRPAADLVQASQHVLGIGITASGRGTEDLQCLAILLPFVVAHGLGAVGAGQRNLAEQEEQEEPLDDHDVSPFSEGRLSERPPWPCRVALPRFSAGASAKPENGKYHQHDDDSPDDIDDVVHYEYLSGAVSCLRMLQDVHGMMASQSVRRVA
ncbi:hypothetical protein QC820_12300 [Halomonas mongoliensis]|uniref:Uncharacterized protein n=1 Tax=Halomonas mongoliensis TaxID=321265 RepID=A0ABU1GNJ6_9GAMM|nr:hypothetical protein [Halomonas mongoliensis]MDR5893591.1 hypothetical protein [Halomonas mongoliensis]